MDKIDLKATLKITVEQEGDAVHLHRVTRVNGAAPELMHDGITRILDKASDDIHAFLENGPKGNDNAAS